MNFNLFDSNYIIFTIYFAILVVFSLLSFHLDRKANVIIFLLLCFLGFLIAALRPLHVGADTITYFTIVERIHEEGWSVLDILLRRASYSANFHDPIGWAFLFLAYDIGGTPLFMLAPQLIFWGATTYFILKNTKYWTFYLLMFVFMRYHEFFMSGLRQSMSISFCMLSYCFYNDRRVRKAGLCLLISSVFHISSLVLLVYPLLQKINILKRYNFCFIALLSAPLVAFIALQIMAIVGIRYGVYSYDGGNNYRWIAVCIILFSYCFIKLFNVKDIFDDYALYGLSFVALFTSFMSFVTILGFRVSLYFGLFVPLLICKIIEKQKSSKELDAILLIFLMIIIYSFTGSAITVGNEFVL